MKRRTIIAGIAGICGLEIAGVATGIYVGRQSLRKEVSSALRYAAADKQAAVDQMAGQIAYKGGYNVTQRFFDLSQKYPWLDGTRKSVGLIECSDPHKFGSAILLDSEGTIALCDHEWDNGNPLKLTFYLEDQGLQVGLHDCQRDKKHDLMFASINPDNIREYGLTPASLGKMGLVDVDKEYGQKIVIVGFPHLSIRLYATEGTVTGFIRTLDTKDDNGKISSMACKYEADAPSFLGMSGGGVFHEGKLIGMQNAINGIMGLDASTYFTPIDLIINAYCDLYPDRAKRSDITPIAAESPLEPIECKIGRRDLVRGLFR